MIALQDGTTSIKALGLKNKTSGPFIHTAQGIELKSNESVNIIITNIQGKIINQVKGFSDQLLPLNHLPQGTYIVSVTAKSGSWEFMIVR